MKRKAKFSAGQVVVRKERYRRVESVADVHPWFGQRYELDRDKTYLYPENELRALTARERGDRRGR